MSTAVIATRRIQVVHWVIVLLMGLPKEVRHADEVCTSDSVTAFTAIIRTSRTSKVFSSPARDENIIFTANGAKANSPSAAGSEIARVIKSDL